MNDDIDPKIDEEEEVDPLKTPIVDVDDEEAVDVPADVVSLDDLAEEEDEDEDALEDLEEDEM